MKIKTYLYILLILILNNISIAAPVVYFDNICPMCAATNLEVRFQIVHTNLTKDGIGETTEVNGYWLQSVTNGDALLRQKLLCSNNHVIVYIQYQKIKKIVITEERGKHNKLNCDTNWLGIKINKLEKR